MMASMSSQSRVRRAPTAEFSNVCKALYGDAVDPVDVWNEVFKASPDQADLHAHRPSTTRRVLEGVALGSTVAGGVLGAKEGFHGARGVYRAVKAGQKVPRSNYGRLALAGAATGGDVITTGVLAAQNKKSKPKKLQPTGAVAKFVTPTALPKLGAITSGIRSGWKSMAPKLGTAATLGAEKVSAKLPKAPMQGTLPGLEHNLVPTARAVKQRAIGADIGTALSTKTGKIAAGTAGAAGIYQAGGAMKRRRSAGMEYAPDPYAYGKRDDTADVEFTGTFSKFDDAKHLAFGWASVTKVDGVPVVDKQDDYIELDDLEEAAYNYVRGNRTGGNMHKRAVDDSVHKVSDMVESMVFTPEKIEKMGLPATFPHGWWVGYKFHDPETWEMIRKRERVGFSIHGRGIRKAADLDEIMGYR
jgi:hypothetical protein